MKKDAEYWISCFGVNDGEDDWERAEVELIALGRLAVPALIAAFSASWATRKATPLRGSPASTPSLARHLRAAR